MLTWVPSSLSQEVKITLSTQIGRGSLHLIQVVVCTVCKVDYHLGEKEIDVGTWRFSGVKSQNRSIIESLEFLELECNHEQPGGPSSKGYFVQGEMRELFLPS